MGMTGSTTPTAVPERSMLAAIGQMRGSRRSASAVIFSLNSPNESRPDGAEESRCAVVASTCESSMRGQTRPCSSCSSIARISSRESFPVPPVAVRSKARRSSASEKLLSSSLQKRRAAKLVSRYLESVVARAKSGAEPRPLGPPPSASA